MIYLPRGPRVRSYATECISIGVNCGGIWRFELGFFICFFLFFLKKSELIFKSPVAAAPTLRQLTSRGRWHVMQCMPLFISLNLKTALEAQNDWHSLVAALTSRVYNAATPLKKEREMCGIFNNSTADCSISLINTLSRPTWRHVYKGPRSSAQPCTVRLHWLACWCVIGPRRPQNFENQLPVKSKMADGQPQNYKYLNRCNCSGLFYFAPNWYRVRLWDDVLQTLKVK